MSIKNLFSGGKTVSRKSLRKNYRQDPTFQKILGDPKIRKVLDKPEEQREFHNLIGGKASDGSVTGNDMREVFDDLVHKRKGKYISAEEGRRMATEFFSDSSRRYKADRSETPSSTENMPTLSSNNKPATPSSKPHIYRSDVRSISSESEKFQNEKASFFNSLRSVDRNRKK